MYSVRSWILCALALSTNCHGLEKSLNVTEDLVMDPLLDSLLQDELDIEDTSADAVIEGEMKLVGEEWLCGTCLDKSDTKLIYSETTDLVLRSTQFQAEIQMAIALDEAMSCVSVNGASSLQVALIEGGCTSSAVTLALRASSTDLGIGDKAYSILVRAYGSLLS